MATRNLRNLRGRWHRILLRQLSFQLLTYLYSHTAQLSRALLDELAPGILRELHTCTGVLQSPLACTRRGD